MKQGKILFAAFMAFLFIIGCAGVQMRTSNLMFEAKDLVSEGDLVGSVPILKKALALDPKSLEANVTMAQVQYRLGNIEQAGKYARLAYKLDQNDFRALGILGLIDLRTGRYERGISRMLKAIKIYNGIEPVGGNLPVEPQAMLERMRYKLKHHKGISKAEIENLADAFWAKVDWYEFDENYRKWHFKSFYEIRPDGGGTIN